MENRGWESIYRIQGEVQSEVLQVVKNAAQFFCEKGYNKIMDLDAEPEDIRFTLLNMALQSMRLIFLKQALKSHGRKLEV